MSKYSIKKGIDSETLYNISQMIKNKRISLGISQKAFAEYVRMDASNYCRFEKGQLNISLLQFVEIIDKLDYLKQQFEKIKEVLKNE